MLSNLTLGAQGGLIILSTSDYTASIHSSLNHLGIIHSQTFTKAGHKQVLRTTAAKALTLTLVYSKDSRPKDTHRKRKIV